MVKVVALSLVVCCVAGPGRQVAQTETDPEKPTLSAVRAFCSSAPLVEFADVADPGLYVSVLRERNDEGEYVIVETALESVGPGLVIRDNKALVLAAGDAIVTGDIIVRAYLANHGDADVWLSGSGATRNLTVHPGDAVAVAPTGKLAATHKQECRCTCEVSVRETCRVILPDSEIDNCEDHNGEACLCTYDGSAGQLKSCGTYWVPQDDSTGSPSGA